jgi:integrase
MPVIKLTEAKIRELPLGSGIWRDEDVKGLMVICHKSCRSYAVQGDVRRNGRHLRTVRVKIDRCDRVGLRDARNRAKALMSTIQSGIDPTEGPAESGITLQGALDAHLAEKSHRPRTAESYKYHVAHYLKGWKNKAVADISRQMVRDLFADLKRKHGDTTASGVMRTLRAVINTARRLDESLPGNPVEALHIPGSKRRKVAPLDLVDWWKKVEKLSPVRRDLHLTMLLTGARRSSVVNVRREDVDLEARVLTFRHQKTSDEPLRFPMGPCLTAILEERLKADEPLNSEWLFPSATSKSGHVQEPREDGLPSPHELRHHARTMFIQAGAPYAESALLLGQKLPGASGGYVHASQLVEHLRKYAEALECLVFSKRPGAVPPAADPVEMVVVEQPPEVMVIGG